MNLPNKNFVTGGGAQQNRCDFSNVTRRGKSSINFSLCQTLTDPCRGISKVLFLRHLKTSKLYNCEHVNMWVCFGKYSLQHCYLIVTFVNVLHNCHFNSIFITCILNCLVVCKLSINNAQPAK